MTRTIALIGHSGLTGKVVVPALAAESSLKLRVLHRPSSNIDNLPSNVEAIKVDYTDVAALTAALQGVDVFVSLVGGGLFDTSGILNQLPIVDAAKEAGVKLFMPSDLAPGYNEEESQAVPIIKAKLRVEERLIQHGIQRIMFHVPSYPEYGLGFPFYGVDVKNNKLDLPGGAVVNPIEFNSLPYISASFAALLTSSDLYSQPKHIGIVEFQATGQEIAAALEKKNGKAPEIINPSAEEVKATWEKAKDTENALVATLRYTWSTKGMTSGAKIFEFGGKKTTIDDFVANL